MVTSQRHRLALIILTAALLVLAYDGYRLWHDSRYNKVIAQGDFEFDDKIDPQRQFANAYGLARGGDFRGAARAYAAIDVTDSDPLWAAIKFNLANLYFREAIRLRDTGADDLSMPLVELAKQHYKDILRTDSTDWESKYNLEIALIVSPDLDAAPPLDERNPEHSSRALTVIKARKPLP